MDGGIEAFTFLVGEPMDVVENLIWLVGGSVTGVSIDESEGKSQNLLW